MNSTVIYANLSRFLFYFFFQVLILKRVDLSIGTFDFMHVLIYPLPILMLPIKTPKALVLLLAFLYGLGVDSFYNSPGVHAAALVFTAYFRELLLKIFEPFEGYNTNDNPTMIKMGLNWFLIYVSIAMLVHCFVYFSVEAFSFVYLFTIVLNTIFSFLVSIIVIVILQFIFRPKY
jgi:hypothetical protein